MRKIRQIFPVYSIFLLPLSFAAVLSESQAALPRDWLRESVQAVPGKEAPFERLQLEALAQRRADRGDAARDFDRYFSASERLATEAPARRKASWYLQSIKVELGVALEGELGFLGAEGEGAVELIWTRKKEAVARLVQERAGSAGLQGLGTPVNLVAESLASTEAALPESSEGVLKTEMTEAQVQAQVDALAGEVLAQNPKIRNSSRLRQALRSEALSVRPLLQALAEAPQEWSWVPYKFQQELYVQAEGSVSPVVAVGAVARVRMEWSISRTSGSARLASLDAPSASKKKAWLQSMTHWMRALDQALAREDGDQKMFKLAAFKVGVGLGAELELGIAELKGSALGSVFFKRVPKATPLPWVYAASSLPRVSVPGDRTDSIPGAALEVGLTKALRISGAITDRAMAYEAKRASERREFELGAIEVELELTTEGEFFLPGVSQRASAELFFVRGGVL